MPKLKITIDPLTRISKLNDKQIIRKWFTVMLVFEADDGKLLGDISFRKSAYLVKRLR